MRLLGDLIQYDLCLYKMGKSGHRHVHREDAVYRWEAVIVVMILQTKEAPRLPASHWKLGERPGTGFPSALRHLDPQRLAFLNYETISFCCSSLPVCGTLFGQC